MANLLSDLRAALGGISIPCETGVYSGEAPQTFAVLTPILDAYSAEGDDRPLDEVQEARISLFSRANYLPVKRRIEAACIAAGLTITDRRYVGHEDDTGYYHYAIDVAHCYAIEQED